uniref:Vasotocin receptor V2 n=1 Tax=Heteropneustes fossilis TaxID=93621 RepID=U5YT44_HETFO|nr:vasotocin receptor V2 [Heteropneustes fossilis]
MEKIKNIESDWDVLTLSSGILEKRTNFSYFATELTSFNPSWSGGSYFGVFLENGSDTTGKVLPQPRLRDQALARAEIAVLVCVLALTTLGNSFVLWVLLRRRKHHSPMHGFMVNLCVAAADAVVLLFQVLPQLIWDITEKFNGPDILCRSAKYLQIVGMFASSYMIVAMTVDRHKAICCPLQAYRAGACSRWNTPVMVAWLLALVLSVPQAFIFSRSEVAPGEFECWGHFASEAWGLKAYVTWMTWAVFLLPALIITICQIRIFREIHNNIYLKSERVVPAEIKNTEQLFRAHVFNKEEDRARELMFIVHWTPDHRFGQLLRWTQQNDESNMPVMNVGALKQPKLSDRWEAAVPVICYHRNDTGALQMFKTESRMFPVTKSPRCSMDYVPPHSPATPPPSITKAMSKTGRMTLVIVLVYTICFSPFFIKQLWVAWDPRHPDQGVAFTILMLLASLNSCTNPWIYTAFSSSVSRELQNLLNCRSRPSRRGSLPDDSTTTHTSTTKDNLY